MSYWSRISENVSPQVEENEFELAAYRLITEQVIYHSDRNSKSSYYLIERFETDFRKVLQPLGVNVKINRQLRYAVAIPEHQKTGSLSTSFTLFALVCRSIYDESARQGNLTDEGEIVIDPVSFSERYRLMTDRELSRVDTEAALRTMKRWGIARKTEDFSSLDDPAVGMSQPFAIAIRPAVTELLGESVLARLASFKQAEPISGDERQSGEGGENDYA